MKWQRLQIHLTRAGRWRDAVLDWEYLPDLGKDSLSDKAFRQLGKHKTELPSCSSATMPSGDTWECPGPAWFVLRSESRDGGLDVEEFGIYFRGPKGSLTVGKEPIGVKSWARGRKRERSHIKYMKCKLGRLGSWREWGNWRPREAQISWINKIQGAVLAAMHLHQRKMLFQKTDSLLSDFPWFFFHATRELSISPPIKTNVILALTHQLFSIYHHLICIKMLLPLIAKTNKIRQHKSKRKGKGEEEAE